MAAYSKRKLGLKASPRENILFHLFEWILLMQGCEPGTSRGEEWTDPSWTLPLKWAQRENFSHLFLLSCALSSQTRSRWARISVISFRTWVTSSNKASFWRVTDVRWLSTSSRCTEARFRSDSSCCEMRQDKRWLFHISCSESINSMVLGPWWWSSGQSSCLLLWRSELESCWLLKFSVRKDKDEQKINC